MKRAGRDGCRNRSRVTMTLLALLLAACGSRERIPERRPSIASASPRDTAICYADLRREGVDFRPLPDKDFGNGCGL